MIEMSKTKLKAQMLKVFRQIERSGESVIVTDRGKPTLRIDPLRRGGVRTPSGQGVLRRRPQ